MKNFTVKYYHGHFVEERTGRRVIPKQGAIFAIQSDDDAFLEEDQKLRDSEPYSRDAQLTSLQYTYGKENVAQLLPAGTYLNFTVGNSIKVEGDEDTRYTFDCELLEDLYIHKIKSREGNAYKDWRLAPCKCQLSGCIDGGLTLTSQLPSQSLNALFRHTVMFYFSMQHSGTCNVFNTFSAYESSSYRTNERYRSGSHGVIGLYRLRRMTLRGRVSD